MKSKAYYDGYSDGYMEALGYRKATAKERKKYGHLLQCTAKSATSTQSSARTIFLDMPVSKRNKNHRNNEITKEL